jgi:hypothetical protein
MDAWSPLTTRRPRPTRFGASRRTHSPMQAFPPEMRHPAFAALACMFAATRMVRVSLEANSEQLSPTLSALCTDVAERVMGYLFGQGAVSPHIRQAFETN